MKRNKFKTIMIFLILVLSVFVSFADLAGAAAPTVTTNNATGILGNNATLQGTLTNDGGIVNVTCENYTTGEDSGMYRSGVSWAAQTFTAASNHSITGVCLSLLRTGGTPGIITVSIRETDGTGHPTAGPDLALGTTNAATLPIVVPAEWRNITLSPYIPAVGVKYAVVVRYSVSYPSQIIWRSDATSPAYAGGNQEYSSNSGATWTAGSDDFMFKVLTGTVVRFNHGLTTGYGANTSYQTKVTGASFSQNIASLTNGMLYHFRASSRNIDGTANGADGSFLTMPGVPLNLSSTSYPTAINLSWSKGSGANRTLVRYSDSGYPLTVTDGTLEYNGTGSSTNATGLTVGKTYYFSLWSFTVWGALSQYSAMVNTYAATTPSVSSFTINYPQYLEVGDYILAAGSIVNNTGVPINNIWCYTSICNLTGVNVTGSNFRLWVVNGYYNYIFSTSTMLPGVYFIHTNFTQAGTNYNATNILYLSQPGGMGHSRAIVYFLYYNTNQGIGLPSDTLQLFVNGTQIFTDPLFYESYTGARINVVVKDYYDFTMLQQNFTVNRTTMPIRLGLTFHSWLFGNTNSRYYMVSLLKQNATRWWERGLVPSGAVEYLIPSGVYRMRIYDASYTELINQSFLIVNSRVYVINGTNLTLVLNGQSMIIGQLIEILDYALTPDVRTVCTNPPMVYSIYDVDGMSLGNGVFKICPAVVTIATTKTTQNGNWVNSSPVIPTNGSVTNGTVTILKDELYIAGNASITWVNVSYTSNGTVMQNTTYIPSKLDLYGQNITINASEDIVVKRVTRYNQLKKFYWTYYSYEGRYNAGINITDPMAVPIYDVYVYVEFANDSNPDFSSVTMRDIANNGTIMKRGENFDVSAGGVHFYLLSINGSSSRSFTIEYHKSVSESFSYGVAESIVDGYAPTVFQGGSYQYFLVSWVNTGSLIFKGTLSVKLNFSNVLDIDPNSIIIQDQDHNIVLSSSGVTQAGDLLMFGSSILGDVNPGGGRAFAVYFLFREYPGADPSVYTMSTPLVILFGVLPVTIFLIGVMVCGIIVTAAGLLYMFDRKGKHAGHYMVLMAVFSLGIFLLIVMQLAGY